MVFSGRGERVKYIREAGNNAELVGDLAALVSGLLLCGGELLLVAGLDGDLSMFSFCLEE